MIRIFLAVNLPADSRERIAAEAQDLYDAAPAVAWVRTPLLHITLKFIGEQDDAVAHGLGEAATRAAAGVPPIRLRFARYGAFPNLGRPRIVWLGITDGADALTRLAGALDAACGTLGIAPETRPFRAHLTLGRVKKDLVVQQRAALAAAMRARSSQESVLVQSIELMRSELGAGGPRYTVLTSAPLGGD